MPGGCFYSDADLQKMGAHTGVAYLEDRPSTCKWLIITVILSPLKDGVVGPGPNGLDFSWLISGDYWELLTKWGDPPSTGHPLADVHVELVTHWMVA